MGILTFQVLRPELQFDLRQFIVIRAWRCWGDLDFVNVELVRSPELEHMGVLLVLDVGS